MALFALAVDSTVKQPYSCFPAVIVTFTDVFHKCSNEGQNLFYKLHVVCTLEQKEYYIINPL